MNHSKKRILLTGSAGGIGTMFLEQARDAYDFVCFDRRPTPGVPDAIVADLTDAEAVRRAAKGCDAILHLGAFAINNWDFLGVLVPSNIIGVYNVLEAAVRTDIKKVVLASSVQTEFGYPDGTKVSVKMPPWPTNFYAATKVFAEHAGMVYSRRGISVICLRFGGVMVPSRSYMGGSDIGLTRNDACEIMRRAIEAEGVKYAVLPAYSRNAAKIKDLRPLKEILGYEPKEDSFEVAGRGRRRAGTGEGGDGDRVEAMLEAADRGDEMAVTAMLKGDKKLANAAGRDPHWESEDLRPLHCAARAGRLKVAGILIDGGAEVNVRDSHLNRTPLHFAADNQHREVAELLIARGAEEDIFVAAALGDTGKVRAFLDADAAAANSRGPEGVTPLHFAGTVEVAQLLLDRGGDPAARDEHRRRTVLSWNLRRPKVARFLAERLGAMDIFVASVLGEDARVKELLALDPALCSARSVREHPLGGGHAPINLAASRGHMKVVEILLEAGADVNTLDRRGATPLHHAAGEGRGDIVRLLLARGANPSYRDDGWEATPLDWAQHRGGEEVVRILKEAMEKR